MVIMIATYSIPTAVSKLVAGKIAMGQYKSDRRIYYCTFIYVVIAGAVAALITYFGAEWFVSDQPNAVLSLKILAQEAPLPDKSAFHADISDIFSQ